MKKILNKYFYEYHLVCFFVMMIIFSFAGWWVENIAQLIDRGVFDSRRQLLPFLFCYGIGVFFVYFVLGTPKRMRIFNYKVFRKNTIKDKVFAYLVYFIVLFVVIFFGEMGVGLLFEKFANVILWDYRKILWHVTKYTSVPTTFGFSLGIELIMTFIFTPIMDKLEKFGTKNCLIIDLTLGSLIVIDFFIMIFSITINKSINEYWSFHFTNIINMFLK